MWFMPVACVIFLLDTAGLLNLEELEKGCWVSRIRSKSERDKVKLECCPVQYSSYSWESEEGLSLIL